MSEIHDLLPKLMPAQQAHSVAAASATKQILRRPVSAEAPLSFAQQQMWLSQQVSPDKAFYNMTCALRLAGTVKQEAVQKAVDTLRQRHEVLRTRFPIVAGLPSQQICAFESVAIPLIDLSDIPADERAARLETALHEQTVQPFRLAEDLPLRVILYRLAEKEHVLLFVNHHIASDRFSNGMMQREFCQFYQAAHAGAPLHTSALPIQYADFAFWQHQTMQSGQWQTQLDYWKTQLRGDLPILDLPSDYARLAPAERGGQARIYLSTALVAALKVLSRQAKATLFMTLLTGFQILLYRYSGQEEMIIGAPFTNRTCPEVEPVFGLFANTLPLRGDLSGNPTVRQLLARTRRVALEAMMNADLPLEKIVEAINPVRDPTRSLLFQTLFTFAEAQQQTERLPDLVVSRLEVDKGLAEFDLLLTVVDLPAGLQMTLNYRADLFAPATIRRMLGHLQNILQAMVTTPDEHISRLPILSAAEEKQLLHDWNQTHFPQPPTLLHGLFEEQCRRLPQQIALIHRDQQLTYRELNQAANQLAHLLCQKGVGAESLVAIFLKRSVQAVIAMLAVLKAGGAFILLDPNWPAERHATILNQGQLKFVITNQAVTARFNAIPPTDTPVAPICLDSLGDTLHQASTENLALSLSAEYLAYVVYTSGSTGAPKGVMCTHQGMANYIAFFAKASERSPADRRLQFATMGSELLIAEVFNILLSGATLVLRPDDEPPSIKEFLHLLTHYQITVTALPATYWQQWTQAMVEETLDLPPSLRVVFTGMDRVQTQPFQIWQEKVGNRIAWFNAYGPAETTCVCTAYKADFTSGQPLAHIPIGRPISNVTHYILDGQMRPVPIGVVGELYVGGMGVARGYLNQPALTAERFIANPFGPGRLYRTGDFVRYLPSGDIEFIGRTDQQVKLRGFRIELSEIENTLNQHPAVQQSIVNLVERAEAHQQLVAYWVAKDQTLATPAELSTWLKAKLPAYMIPGFFVQLENLPLTHTGKLDRRALPTPTFSYTHSPITQDPPRTPIEQSLLQLWQKLLCLEQISIHDDFFQLGGHSLLAVQLIMEVERVYQCNISLKTFIFAPTIAQLAEAIAGQSSATEQLALPQAAQQDRLQQLYEQLDAPDAFRRLRQPRHQSLRLGAQGERVLRRLPSPLALPLLRQIVRSQWAQQRYWAKEVALIRQFYPVLDTPITVEGLVENSLFYNLLHRYGMDWRLAVSPVQTSAARPLAQINGLAWLETAKAQGHGVILVNHHTLALGWFHWREIIERGIFGVNEVVKHEGLSQTAAPILFARQLQLAQKTLQQGGVIMLAPDGYQGSGPGRARAFHGRLRYFRTAFAELSLLTGAPILPLMSEMQPGQPITMNLLPPLAAGDASMPYAARVEALSNQYLTHLHQVWRATPWMLPWYQMEKHLACPPVLMR